MSKLLEQVQGIVAFARGETSSEPESLDEARKVATYAKELSGIISSLDKAHQGTYREIESMLKDAKKLQSLKRSAKDDYLGANIDEVVKAIWAFSRARNDFVDALKGLIPFSG